MATLTNKQRFIVNSILALVAILVGVIFVVACINASINHTTNEIFRYVISAFIAIAPLVFWADITIHSYKLYNSEDFKYYR